MYRFLYIAIPVVVLTLLFGLPLVYSLWSREPKRIFWFTWILWTIVCFIFGIFQGVWLSIITEVTGVQPDGGVTCAWVVTGALVGWLPGAVLGAIGAAFGRVFKKHDSVVKENEADIREER